MEELRLVNEEVFGLSKGKIIVSRNENSRLENALFNCYGGPLQISKNKLSKNQGKGTVKYEWSPWIKLEDGGDVVLKEILTTEGLTGDPFFNFIFSQLPEEEKETVLSYFNQGGRVISFRREKPSEEFSRALVSYSERHHGGFAPLTTAVLSMLTLHNEENNIPFEEKKEFERLQRLSQERTPIHFFPLKKLENRERQKELKAIFRRFNQLSDPWEFVYDLFLTNNEILRKQILFSSAFVGAGVGSYLPLKAISHHWGELWSMIISQLSGEGLIQLLNRADILFYNPRLRRFLAFLGINLADIANDDWNQNIESETNLGLIEKIVSFSSLLSTVPTAFYLSQKALEKGEITPFLLIAPINSSLLFLGEILTRTLRVRKTLNQYNQDDREKVLQVLKENAGFLKRIIDRTPSLSIALIDFAQNAPALFAYLGTLVSLPVLVGVNKFISSLPLEINEALSAFVFEGAAGLIGGLGSSYKKDPYQEFITLMEKISFG